MTLVVGDVLEIIALTVLTVSQPKAVNLNEIIN
jgi:hypothetical protein